MQPAHTIPEGTPLSQVEQPATTIIIATIIANLHLAMRFGVPIQLPESLCPNVRSKPAVFLPVIDFPNHVRPPRRTRSRPFAMINRIDKRASMSQFPSALRKPNDSQSLTIANLAKYQPIPLVHIAIQPYTIVDNTVTVHMQGSRCLHPR